MKRPLFKAPVGQSEHKWSDFGTWRAVTCELCGTNHPELDDEGESYHLITFMGMQCVEECCGKAIDIVYEESGADFAVAYLNEFAKNPGGAEFGSLRWALAYVLKTAREKIRESGAQLKIVEEDLKSVVLTKERVREIEKMLADMMSQEKGLNLGGGNNGR